MATRIYGASDDLIEFDGDIDGEAGATYRRDDDEGGDVVFCDDGTIARIRYGKDDNLAVWAITVIQKGRLFDRVDICTDEDADPYSDVLHLKDGAKRAWVAKSVEAVK